MTMMVPLMITCLRHLQVISLIILVRITITIKYVQLHYTCYKFGKAVTRLTKSLSTVSIGTLAKDDNGLSHGEIIKVLIKKCAAQEKELARINVVLESRGPKKTLVDFILYVVVLNPGYILISRTI